MEYFDLMQKSCDNEKIPFNQDKYMKFIKYKELLKEWNEKVNLTAITEDREIIIKHFIDSIKIMKFTPLMGAQSVIDVGTGAGFPGIPIKIINEKAKVVLLDSLNKRINFLNEVISELKLDGITTVHSRAEDGARETKHRDAYDVAVSRAVANMTVLTEFCLPYVKKNGYFVALKGPSVEDEIKDAKGAIKILGGKLEEIIEVCIEESDLKHNLVIIKKVKETPAAYPRKAGIVAKNPLK